MKNISIILLLLFSVIACGKKKTSEADFLYSLANTNFYTKKYRAMGASSWIRTSGKRTTIFSTSNGFGSYFTNYSEGIYSCDGSIVGDFSEIDESAFSTAIAGASSTASSTTSTTTVYSVYDTYSNSSSSDSSSESTTDSETASDSYTIDIRYFQITTSLDQSILSSSCPILLESTYYFKTYFFHNGDLLLKDYNRNLEFFLRPD